MGARRVAVRSRRRNARLFGEEAGATNENAGLKAGATKTSTANATSRWRVGHAPVTGKVKHYFKCPVTRAIQPLACRANLAPSPAPWLFSFTPSPPCTILRFPPAWSDGTPAPRLRSSQHGGV